MNLSLENLIDLRRVITRHVKSLEDIKTVPQEVRAEVTRQKRSLAESLSSIEMEIKDIQFEMEKLNF